MVESKFATSKFVNIVKQHKEVIDAYIVIETKTARSNIDEILNEAKKTLSGIVIGRSDFTKSLGFEKDKADSDELYEMVEEMMVVCNQHNIPVTMGGSISVKSIDFIKRMYQKKLLHKIETRNVLKAASVKTREVHLRKVWAFHFNTASGKF